MCCAKSKQQFPQWAHKLGEDHLLDLAVLGQVSDTSLTRDVAFKMESSGLPNTFVPGATCSSSRWRRRWPTGATCRCWSPASAKPIFRATLIAATTP